MTSKRTYRGEVYEDLSGQWRWRIIAPNGRHDACSGEGFDSAGNARRALRRVIAVCAAGRVVLVKAVAPLLIVLTLCWLTAGVASAQSVSAQRQATLKQFKRKALPTCAALNDLAPLEAANFLRFIPGCGERITCFSKEGSFLEFVVDPLGPSGGHVCPERGCKPEDGCTCRWVYGRDEKSGAYYDLAWPADPLKRGCLSRYEMHPKANNHHDFTETFKALGGSVSRVVATGNPCTSCPECAGGQPLKFPGTAVECTPEVRRK